MHEMGASLELTEEITLGRATGGAVARPAFLGLSGLSALRHRDFRVLCLGLLLASSSIMFQYMAIGRLIATYFPEVLGDSFPVLLMLGLVGLTRGAGVLLFSLLGGALADRVNRRSIAIATQVAALLVSGLFTVLILTDSIQVWQVFVLLFATAAAQSFDWPARQAIIVEVVDDNEITSAVSFSTAAMQTSFAISPLLAGSALDVLGIGGAFALSLAGHGAILVSLLMIHYRGSRLAGDSSMLTHIGEGFGYARRHAEIMSVLVISFAVSAFVNGVVYNLSPYWLPEVLHASPFTWGLVASVWGLGAISVAYGLSLPRDFRHKGLIFLGGSLAGSALLIAWAATRSIVTFGVIQLFMGALLNATIIAGATIIQTRVPNEARGRLMALFWLNPACMMMSGVLIGALAEGLGATPAALATGIGMTAAMSAAWVALPGLRRVH
jgi:MFS family permease